MVKLQLSSEVILAPATFMVPEIELNELINCGASILLRLMACNGA